MPAQRFSDRRGCLLGQPLNEPTNGQIHSVRHDCTARQRQPALCSRTPSMAPSLGNRERSLATLPGREIGAICRMSSFGPCVASWARTVRISGSRWHRLRYELGMIRLWRRSTTRARFLRRAGRWLRPFRRCFRARILDESWIPSADLGRLDLGWSVFPGHRWWARRGSNPRPSDYESLALTN